MSPAMQTQTASTEEVQMRVCPVCQDIAPQFVLLPDINDIQRAVDVSAFPCGVCVARYSAWLDDGK